jgi:hypothetical protein
VKLYEAARLVRSKNAGPFMLTIDIMFDDEGMYRLVRDSGVMSAHAIAGLYDIDPADVQVFDYRPALALKVSFPRPAPSGAHDDSDVYGGQYHSPLVMLDIPGTGG